METVKTRVILVEDHDLLRHIMRVSVDNAACCRVVAEAACGQKALEVIKTTPADLILLDLSLPGQSGLSVLKASKKMCSAKILVVTMAGGEDIAEEVLAAGADGIVLKDRGVKVLEHAILETLAGNRPVYLEK